MKPTSILICLLMLIIPATTSQAGGTVPSEPPPLPNPVLYLARSEPFDMGGKHFIRYMYEVFNAANYPNALFAPAPELPPCGANTKSSRTWVDLYDQRGKRLYGFCAFNSSENLNKIWFAIEADVIPPSWI